MAKEHIGEDIVSEINASGSIDAVAIKIRNDIDPFFLRVDNPEDVRVSADLPERERDEVTNEFVNPDDKRLPKGDFGDYCPVSYVDEGFLIKGNPELEVTVFGKTYTFSGEKEMEAFKVNPAKYMIAQEGNASLPLEPPAPKMMILGTKGAGITT
jgi:adenylate/nucleoside-diphosphate kinase